MPNVLTVDVETTISNKGNPFDNTNKLVCVGVKWLMADGNSWAPVVYYDSFEGVQEAINKADYLVGFNIKFDLHWLRKTGIDISNVKVWDCQLAEFILNNQKTPYPSLNDAAQKYGYTPKLDVVKLEYWDKGIDTDKIPRVILTDYLNQDLILTQQVYEKQLELFKTTNKDQAALFKLHCFDLMVLEEMEWNGLKFNTEKALQHADTIDKELEELRILLGDFLGHIPFNASSNDHVSAALYGGTIVDSIRIPIGVYKTGAKAGETRYKIVEKEYVLPRLCYPIEGTETAKSAERRQKGETQEETLWEVNEKVLRQLKLSKEAKKFVSMLNRVAELEKLSGTYLRGYTQLIEKMNWDKDTLHGTLNQCVVVTGRLSSSKPNMQNVDPITKVYMETRYA